MAEQKPRYMEVLDKWTDEHVVGPLWGHVEEEALDGESSQVVGEVKKAIREKVLESFRNGQRTGPYKQPARPQKQTQK